MTIRLDEAQIQRRLRLDRGLQADLQVAGREVAEKARANASGQVIGIRSGDLLAGIFVRTGIDALGEFVEIGSDAVHRNANYPEFVHRASDPPAYWLTKALDDTIGIARSRGRR